MIETGSRILWIDRVKGICMLCVMLHHFPFTPDIYRTLYAPFFLTGFFVMSGYTFHPRGSYLHFFIRKIWVLLIPLFLLGFANIVLSQILSFNEQSDFWEDVAALFIQQGTGGHRLWFIAAMFISCAIFYPVARIKNKYLFLSVIMSAGIVNIIFRRWIYSEALPWHVDVIGMACFWMGMGYFACNFVGADSVKKWLSARNVLWINLCLYAAFVCVALVIFSTDYVGFSDFSKNPALYFALNGLGVWVIAGLSSRRFPGVLSNLLIFIGQNTLFYFAFHGKVQSIFMKILSVFNLLDVVEKYPYIFAPAMTVMEAVALIAPCVIVNRCFPIAVGKGYRKYRGK